MIINEILMFIGAGPGSTAGGIKITTFILLSMIFLSFIKQKDSVVMYKKFIPQIIVYRTISIFLFAISWLIFAYTILLATKQQIPATLSQDASHRLLFELISAFGTVGLSTGITNYLNLIGKIVIIITMFFGRLGPTVIAVTIRRSEYPVQIEYPEEQVMVG
jgi:trk system potassium uptake protein TrkH